MQCDPRALLKQASPFLSPYLGPGLNLWRRPRTLQTGVEWVRNDCRAPGSWDDGQMPSCQGERTWLLYPQVHCPLPRPKQLIFDISIPWLIFKHGSFPDKFFRGAFAVGLGGSRLSWQRTSPEQDGCPPRPGCPATVAGADSRPDARCLEGKRPQEKKGQESLG